MVSSFPEAYANTFFQIQPPVFVVNFSNNASIPQVRVNFKKTEHETTCET